jgi:hypothetical protein
MKQKPREIRIYFRGQVALDIRDRLILAQITTPVKTKDSK